MLLANFAVISKIIFGVILILAGIILFLMNIYVWKNLKIAQEQGEHSLARHERAINIINGLGEVCHTTNLLKWTSVIELLLVLTGIAFLILAKI